MEQLKEKLLKLTQETNSMTRNPLLDCFEQDELGLLDKEANTDQFICDKKKQILNLIQDIGIDFNTKLISAYNEYCEAMTYYRLKKKFDKVERVPEGKNKTPDFKIEFTIEGNGGQKQCTLYAELKSMAYADGDLNYKKVMEQGVQSQIETENQFNQGKRISFQTIVVEPLHKNKSYDPYSTRYAIETLISKIEQNIKKEQYLQGDTVLIIDLKQLTLPSHFIEGGVAIFHDKQKNCFMSGVLWNAAFGKIGHLIFKQIEFEGKENVDGELEQEGILVSRDYIKAIIFLDYKLGDKEPKIVGLYKQCNTNECIEAFLHEFCDFVNDEKNTNAWKLTTND